MVDKAANPPEQMLRELLGRAVRLLEEGRYDDASYQARHALLLKPNCADAYFILGVVGQRTGSANLARANFQSAVGLDADNLGYRVEYARTLYAAADFKEALAQYERCLELSPDDISLLIDASLAAQEVKKFDKAKKFLLHALTLQPDAWDLHFNYGNLLGRVGDIDAAILSLQKAMQLNPSAASVYVSLSYLLARQQKMPQAESFARIAANLAPDSPEALNQLGVVLQAQKKHTEACDAFAKIIEIKPDSPDALSNWSLSLNELGANKEAIPHLRRAIKLAPGHVDITNNLACAICYEGEPSEALQLLRSIESKAQGNASYYSNLGTVLQDLGEPAAGRDAYRRSHEFDQQNNLIFSNLLFSEHYVPGVTAQSLLPVHQAFDSLYGNRAELAYDFPLIDRNPNRPLRVAVASPDLLKHPVGFFLLPLLELHKPAECRIICYNDVTKPDSMTDRIRQYADEWIDSKSMNSKELRDRMRADKIDIMLDMSGHTAHNRMAMIAHKPAPIIASWGGYVGTTGVAAVDYLIADRFHIPPGSEDAYTEKIVRMPHGYVTFVPAPYCPEVADLPAKRNGYITFGCFNNAPKFNDPLYREWAKLLQAMPSSHLFLKNRAMADKPLQQKILAIFAEYGIAAERIRFQGVSGHFELLNLYNQIDIALDPAPYSGGLTTLEALWMGVPVVTLAGQHFAGRHSTSHISNAGFPEWVTSNWDEYRQTAIALASDIDQLAAIKSSLRPRFMASPLYNYQAFYQDLLRFFRTAFQQWCNGTRDHINL